MVFASLYLLCKQFSSICLDYLWSHVLELVFLSCSGVEQHILKLSLRLEGGQWLYLFGQLLKYLLAKVILLKFLLLAYRHKSAILAFILAGWRDGGGCGSNGCNFCSCVLFWWGKGTHSLKQREEHREREYCRGWSKAQKKHKCKKPPNP